jgi:hypothetical protein
VRRAAALAALALLGACAGAKHVTPVGELPEKRVCIIENPKVMHDVAGALRRALEERGYAVEVLPAATAAGACPVTARYVAFWRWDLVLYVAHAEIRVYKSGNPAGRAVYQARGARRGGDSVIKELVDDLFKS